MKFCKDCKWIRPPNPRAMCGHPSSFIGGEIDLVTGKHRPLLSMACEDVRFLPSAHSKYCGREAVHWEPIVVGFVEDTPD
jgi:hypothetical protein